MHAAALEVEIRIPGARSLKEKRKVVVSAVQRIRRAYPVAVAEVADHDLWQRATLGIGFVAGQRSILDEGIAAVIRMLDGRLDLEVIRVTTSYLDTDDVGQSST